MCHEMAHFSSCPILAEYTQLGKVSRNVQNLLILGNGDSIPNNPMNHSWAAWVNKFYTRNPHLLRDPPLHIQANFVANFLKVHRKSPQREENLHTGKKSSDLLTWAANKLVWLMDTPWAKKNCSAPKALAPSAKPLLSTPEWAEPLPKSDTQHPWSQRSMHQTSSAKFFLRKSAFQLKNCWL